jgi:hypothetical protein
MTCPMTYDPVLYIPLHFLFPDCIASNALLCLCMNIPWVTICLVCPVYASAASQLGLGVLNRYILMLADGS